MDCRVVVEAAVPVYDVTTADEAVRIAISKTGGMLNPDLSYVEIDVGSRRSPSGEALEPAFIVADEALVALELTMTVFNVEREEHAARIARKEIGQRMHDVPLDVLEVSVLEAENGEESENENGDRDEAREETGTDGENAASRKAASETGSETAPDTDTDTDTSIGSERATGEENSGRSAREAADAAERDRSDPGEDDTDGANEEDREDDSATNEDILPEFEDLIDE